MFGLNCRQTSKRKTERQLGEKDEGEGRARTEAETEASHPCFNPLSMRVHLGSSLPHKSSLLLSSPSAFSYLPSSATLLTALHYDANVPFVETTKTISSLQKQFKKLRLFELIIEAINTMNCSVESVQSCERPDRGSTMWIVKSIIAITTILWHNVTLRHNFLQYYCTFSAKSPQFCKSSEYSY